MNKADERRAEVVANQVGKAGLRGKINAMCAYCIFDPIGGGGTWRQQVQACTSTNCPLYSVRPSVRPKAEA